MTNRRSRRYAVLGLSVSCLVLAACSNPVAAPTTAAADLLASPVAASPTAPADTPTQVAPATIATGRGATTACALVTEQEAAAALGADPGPGQETPLGDTASACSYLAGQSILQLSLTRSGGKAVYDSEHAGIPSGTPGITEVSGVGDSAFSQVKGTRAAINFDKGDAMVVIGLTSAGAPASQEQLSELATAAASRM